MWRLSSYCLLYMFTNHFSNQITGERKRDKKREREKKWNKEATDTSTCIQLVICIYCLVISYGFVFFLLCCFTTFYLFTSFWLNMRATFTSIHFPLLLFLLYTSSWNIVSYRSFKHQIIMFPKWPSQELADIYFFSSVNSWPFTGRSIGDDRLICIAIMNNKKKTLWPKTKKNPFGYFAQFKAQHFWLELVWSLFSFVSPLPLTIHEIKYCFLFHFNRDFVFFFCATRPLNDFVFFGGFLWSYMVWMFEPLPLSFSFHTN